VDAQGNLLSHPMVRAYGVRMTHRRGSFHRKTWLDERLFGWSRSAESSRDVSRAASPQGSDDEDAGDYDDLLKVPHPEGKSSKLQGQRGSYADLQKLRAVGRRH
jgi:glycerol-3-phosphate O-acyltransferase / dihydroxyacetone phosphate acyltransferase